MKGIKKEGSMIDEYFNIYTEHVKEYGEKTVILMMVGSFYEIYGEIDNNKNISGSKIVEISKICDLSIAQKIASRNIQGTHVMAGFTYTKIDKYLIMLISRL